MVTHHHMLHKKTSGTSKKWKTKCRYLIIILSINCNIIQNNKQKVSYRYRWTWINHEYGYKSMSIFIYLSISIFIHLSGETVFAKLKELWSFFKAVFWHIFSQCSFLEVRNKIYIHLMHLKNVLRQKSKRLIAILILWICCLWSFSFFHSKCNLSYLTYFNIF